MSVGAVSSAPQEIHRHHGMHGPEKTKSTDTTDSTLSPDAADTAGGPDGTDAATAAAGGTMPLSSDLLAFLSQLQGGASPSAAGTTTPGTVGGTGTAPTSTVTAGTLSQSASTVLADLRSFVTQLQASDGGTQTASITTGNAMPPPPPTDTTSGSDAGDATTGPDGSRFGGGFSLHHLMRALESYAAADPSASTATPTTQGSDLTA